MRVTLEVIAGPHRGQKIVLRSGEVVQVGRTEFADRAFPLDARMSGVHFSVDSRPDGCLIRDLGSRNGTSVDGKRISETLVRDGQRVEAGISVFTVHVEGGPTSVPEAESPAVENLPRATLPDPMPPLPLPAEAKRTISDPEEGAEAESLQRVEPLSGVREGLRVVLHVADGTGTPRRILLRPGESVRVGRTEWADVSFPQDPRMSGLHFAVECSQADCRIRDLGSSNGTLVNGQRVTDCVLTGGEVVIAGRTRFVVRIEGVSGPVMRQADSAAHAVIATWDDPDPEVRHEALLAAVWTRQPSLLQHCRKAAERFSPENWDLIVLLAILGKPDNLPRIIQVARTPEWGPRRFEALGKYGHPAVIDHLLPAIGEDDPPSAMSAAEAFTKITGEELDLVRRAKPPSDAGSPPAEESLLPDPRRARSHWEAMKGKFPGCTRLCRGFDLSNEVPQEVLDRLDMESRWEAILRARFAGAWRGRLADLERFKHGAGD